MKKLLVFASFVGLLALVACGDKGGSGGSSGYATTPQPCNAQEFPGYNQAYGNCQQYQQYYQNQQFNWNNGQQWFWPQSYQPNNGYCGCSWGYTPVTGPFGFACAPSTFFRSSWFVSVGYWGAYWNAPQNNQWVNIPQQTFGTGNYGNCSQQTAQGCDVRVNSCPSGLRCQPVAGGSTLGLCTR